jgi:hypothetical protein
LGMCGSSKSKSHPAIADKQSGAGESIVYKVRVRVEHVLIKNIAILQCNVK